MERVVKRYTAYFKDWAQAFGEHKNLHEAEGVINWLVSEEQIGLMLPDKLRKLVYKEVLGKKGAPPVWKIVDSRFEIGEFEHKFDDEAGKAGLNELMKFFKANETAHLYLTYHFLYPQGTRIITISSKGPLGLVYKEIDPITVLIED